MTRLDRVLNLLEEYDSLSSSAINNECERVSAERWIKTSETKRTTHPGTY